MEGGVKGRGLSLLGGYVHCLTVNFHINYCDEGDEAFQEYWAAFERSVEEIKSLNRFHFVYMHWCVDALGMVASIAPKFSRHRRWFPLRGEGNVGESFLLLFF